MIKLLKKCLVRLDVKRERESWMVNKGFGFVICCFLYGFIF